MQVILASKNAGKVVELQRILQEFPGAEKLEILSLEKFPQVEDIAETGKTFIENALLKAHAIANATGLPAIADDSGICVDYLNGAPGIFSARYSGNGDAANNEKLLAALKDVPEDKRGAHFYCAAVFVTPDSFKEEIEIIAEGKFEGVIAQAVKGLGGFGYDPLFIPTIQKGEITRTSAELSAEEKDSISHRGNALRSLVPKILASELLR